MNKLPYDDTDPLSIEEYGKKLINRTFQDVINYDTNPIRKVAESGNYAATHENKKRKGSVGELIEECHFHYKANNDSRPDFEKAGVELKVTPYKINKNGSLSSKERVIITMIDYESVIHESFENSSMWKKARLILLVYYLYRKEIENRLDYEIKYVQLFSPPKSDIQIIKHDFEIIVNKIRAGKAHELSESDTLYLGAATKASTSEDRRSQPNSTILAKPRAFAFKNSYMNFVLNNYIVPHRNTYDSITKGHITTSFEDYVCNKIYSYSNYTVEELCNEFNFTYDKRPKNLESKLAYCILGVKSNKAEEFIKANICVKTIRINNNNTINESMSFPAFKFKELAKETWETSILANTFSQTRYLFVIYKFDEYHNLRLKGCQFWNMPFNDLESHIKSVWEQTKEVIENGIEVYERNGRRYNNFPKSTDNPVCHVRPHGRNAADTYELPNGTFFTKQCFWLNKSYILSQLNKEFLT